MTIVDDYRQWSKIPFQALDAVERQVRERRKQQRNY
jgi:hypothetical protein